MSFLYPKEISKQLCLHLTHGRRITIQTSNLP